MFKTSFTLSLENIIIWPSCDFLEGPTKQGFYFIQIKVSQFSTSQKGNLDLQMDSANNGGISSDLYYNHSVAIHVDTDICSVLRGTVTLSLTVSICIEIIVNVWYRIYGFSSLNTQNTTNHIQVYLFKITVQWDIYIYNIYNIPFMKTVDFNMNHIVKLPSWDLIYMCHPTSTNFVFLLPWLHIRFIEK